MKLEFSRQIFKKSSKSVFLKVRLVGAELFHADGPTDGHDEAGIAFRSFTNAPHKIMVHTYCISSCP
jgi:hypothetical protein